MQKQSWIPAPTPFDELQRTRRIARFGLRNGQRHQPLDELVAMAAGLFHAPIALVTLIDGEHQIFLAKFGLDADGTGRAESFCGHGLHSPGALVVDDSTADPRFADNPLVVGAPFVRAYLGVPLLGGAGESAIGSLCLIDRQARTWTSAEQEQLVSLSSIVENYLEGLASQRVWDDAPLALVMLDRQGRCLRVNPAFAQLTGVPLASVAQRRLASFAVPADRDALSAMLAGPLPGADAPTYREVRLERPNGDVVRCGVSLSPLTGFDEQVICVLRDLRQEARGASPAEVVTEVRHELAGPLAEARALAQALIADDQASEGRGAALNASLDRLHSLVESRLDDLGARLRAEEELRAREQRARAEQERMGAVIKASLAEKENLLKEIHHRVKNNLQIVSSLLSLQKSQMTSDAARDLIGECGFRVHAMAMIHEQLYGTTTLDRINLATYARELVDSLSHALAPQVRLHLVAAPVEMTVENAVPFGLILNELVTNSFKYGVRANAPDDGGYDLSIELSQANGLLSLVVRDRGRGLPPDFDVAKGRGLGLQIVRGLARQLKGKIVARTEGGAVFEFTCRV